MAKINRTPDAALRGTLFFTLVLLIVVGWIAGYVLVYNVPRPMFFKAMVYALLATPKNPLLWIGPVVGLIAGIVLFAYGAKNWTNNFGGGEYVNHLRGPKLVNPNKLASMTKRGKDQLSFFGIPIPRDVENTHFFVGGSTGAGKSQLIADYIESLQARGDRMVCVDPDGGFMRSFFKPGDVIMNPFDRRGHGWSIFNEIRVEFDCEQFAISMIPRSPSTEAEQWNSMARTIVSETLHILVKSNELSTERMVYWLTMASNDDLKKLLSSTPAAGCFHGAEDTLASIRTVLTQYVTPHKYLPPGEFSFRDYLEQGTGNIWVTWREDQLQALKPLISCWTDVICASVLSMPEDPGRRLHLVCDELDSLEKLNYIKDVATKGRKKGFRMVVGVQSLAQLNDVYGRDDALTLRNSFRSIAFFGISPSDTYTTEEFSKALGEHTVIRKTHSASLGGSGKGSARGTSASRVDTERLVSPAEIPLLPNLTGYLKFSGKYPISRVTMPYTSRPELIEPMLMADQFLVNVRDQHAMQDEGEAETLEE